MKKLEERIVKKIYRLETKKTAGYLLSRLFFGILLVLSSWLLFLSLLDILDEQSSFSLLDFFKDDFEVIQKYFMQNIIDFYQELPQPLTLILLTCIILILVLITLFIINFNKLKNKLFSLYKFYLPSRHPEEVKRPKDLDSSSPSAPRNDRGRNL